MSQENVEIVRRPLRVRDVSTRTLDQRFLLRFPRLTAAYVRLVGRLSASSRLRQAAIGRGVRIGLEAYNRDLEAAFIGWNPGFELHPGRRWVEDGRVIRAQEYFDHPEALQAAGLRE